MFRNTLVGAVILAMSAAVTAATPPAGRPGTCTLDPGRYVQTQLDWRSYYLNRLDGPRYRVSPDTDANPQPPIYPGS